MKCAENVPEGFSSLYFFTISPRTLVRTHFKTFGNPTRKRGMSLELLRLQSLAHASGYRMSCKRGFEMRSSQIGLKIRFLRTISG
jgi:hypothetical protein